MWVSRVLRSWIGFSGIATAVITTVVTRSDVASASGQAYGLYEENDFFGIGDPSDRHYTQGLRLFYKWQESRPWFFVPRERYRDAEYVNGLVFGHNIYTPRDITSPTIDPHDRPYGGWLYVGATSDVISRCAGVVCQDSYELNYGVVGEHAQGDAIQSRFHKMIGADNPTWVGELPSEPAVTGIFERRWIPLGNAGEWSKKDWRSYITPTVGVRAGNVLTDIKLGLTVVAGYNTPLDFGVGVHNPSLLSQQILGADPRRPLQRYFSIYASLGVEGRGVWHNAFLDGTLFHDSRCVDRNDLVTDYIASVAIRWHSLRVSYLRLFRTPEIESARELQNFGAVQLAIVPIDF